MRSILFYMLSLDCSWNDYVGAAKRKVGCQTLVNGARLLSGAFAALSVSPFGGPFALGNTNCTASQQSSLTNDPSLAGVFSIVVKSPSLTFAASLICDPPAPAQLHSTEHSSSGLLRADPALSILEYQKFHY